MIRNRKAFFLLGLAVLLGITACDRKIMPPPKWANAPVVLEVPQGFPALPVPADNPLTETGIELGRMLFYDPILSADSTQSCASCHAQAFSFSDNGKRWSEGIDGIEGDINAPHIVNPGWGTSFFWDGREATLEEQAFQPVINPIEMHDDWDNVVMKLERHPTYPKLFYNAFQEVDITSDLVTKAIAQFERTLISGNSRYDKVRLNDPTADFTQEEFNGYITFFTEKGDCFHCHTVDLMTDDEFHVNGVDSVFEGIHAGRFNVTGDSNDLGKWKTPSLRNIAETAPYMHDGRFATLEAVVEFYNSGVHQTPQVDPIMSKPGKQFGLGLTETEKAELVAFLKTLSDTTFLNNPAFSNPFE